MGGRGGGLHPGQASRAPESPPPGQLNQGPQALAQRGTRRLGQMGCWLGARGRSGERRIKGLNPSAFWGVAQNWHSAREAIATGCVRPCAAPAVGVHHAQDTHPSPGARDSEVGGVCSLRAGGRVDKDMEEPGWGRRGHRRPPLCEREQDEVTGRTCCGCWFTDSPCPPPPRHTHT